MDDVQQRLIQHVRLKIEHGRLERECKKLGQQAIDARAAGRKKEARTAEAGMKKLLKQMIKLEREIAKLEP